MDCASPRLALFTSAVDGAPVGLELGWRGHQELCAIVEMKVTASSWPQRFGPPSILLSMPSWEFGQAQGQAGSSNCLLLTSITS